MNRKNINPEYKFGDTDGFKLTDIDTDESLMLIPCDTAGNFSWTGVTRAPLQRNAMQTSTTNNQYSDLEKPWISIPQEDWTGGRANDIFTKDTTRYRDGKRCQTSFNQVIYNAPLEYYSKGFRKAETNCPGNLKWQKVTGSLAVAFTPKETFDAGELYIHLRRHGDPEEGLNVKLVDSLSSATTLAEHTYTVDEITDVTAEFKKFTFDGVTLTSGQTYYIVVSAGGSYNHYWQVGVNVNANGYDQNGHNVNYQLYYRIAEAQEGYRAKFFMYEQLEWMVRQKPNGTPTLWMNGYIGRVGDTHNWTEDQWAGARVGLVYRNGIEGQVSVWRTIVSNTAEELSLDEPWDIEPQEGSAFIIVDTPIWTEVTGHGLTSAVTDIHVIRGVVYFAQGDYTPIVKMRWNLDTGEFEYSTPLGWLSPSIQATFIQSVRDSSGMMLYYAKNDGEGHRRTIYRSHLVDALEFDPSAKYWDYDGSLSSSSGIKYLRSILDGEPREDDDAYIVDYQKGDVDFSGYFVSLGDDFTSNDNTGKLTLTLQESINGYQWEDVTSFACDSGGPHIFYAHCKYRYRRIKAVFTGNGNATDFIVQPTDSIFPEDVIPVLDNYGKITRLYEYGAEQEKFLWVFQEGMISSINKTEETYHLDRINIDELITTAEEWNGKAIASSDVYLLWSWLNGLQRYYNTQLEGKGPDHDEGLPFDRQGRITQIVSYPSNVFISIAADDGYSSVMQFNQSGWAELYRTPNVDEIIYDMAFQPIYGSRPDRLWMQAGDDIIWLAMPSKILYALQDKNAEYTHESIIISAWHTAGMIDIEKLWQSLKVMADNLEKDVCWIEADYQLDEENVWHPIKNFYTDSPSQKEELSEHSVNGKKLRYRLRLQTSDIHKTPKVNAVVLEAIGRVDIKQSYTFYFRNIKYKRDLNGEFENIEPLEVQNLLDDWANRLKKLRLNSRWLIYDNKIVYLDGVQTSVLNELSEGYIAQISLNEL